MASKHWSKEQWSLWWLDKGTLRKRVSFATSKDTLLRRFARVYHEGIDAALYNPDGERVPLGAPKTDEIEPPKPKGKGKGKSKRKAKPVDAVATDQMAVTV